jgi:curved DNA-binding protein CbpA
MTDHYTTLGVEKTADTATIKRAYRRRAKKAHPDAGGTDAEFRNLNRALVVLTDPNKRAHYDETGHDQEDLPPQKSATALLLSIFHEAIQRKGLDVNIVQVIRETLESEMMALHKQVSDAEGRIAKYQTARDRFTVKGDLPNIFRDSLLEKIAAEKANLATAKQEITRAEEAMEVLSHYGDSFEPPEPTFQYRSVFTEFAYTKL